MTMIVADYRASFALRGVRQGVLHFAETVHMGLVLVDVCDDIHWVPCKDMFEKFEKSGCVLIFATRNFSPITFWSTLWRILV